MGEQAVGFATNPKGRRAIASPPFAFREVRAIELIEISWPDVLSAVLHLTVAYALALPVAWNQERTAKSAGIRTFPLVAVGACGYMLIGRFVLENEEALSRIVYGIVTGIGFIGGGAILKGRSTVHGTSTAASIWNTGAIGVAVAWNRLEIAIILSLLNYLTLSLATPLKKKLKENGKRENEAEDE